MNLNFHIVSFHITLHIGTWSTALIKGGNYKKGGLTNIHWLLKNKSSREMNKEQEGNLEGVGWKCMYKLMKNED